MLGSHEPTSTKTLNFTGILDFLNGACIIGKRKQHHTLREMTRRCAKALHRKDIDNSRQEFIY